MPKEKGSIRDPQVGPALLVGCPYCGAKIGFRCQATNPVAGIWTSFPHLLRVEKYEKWKKEFKD